ncbi:MAG: molecular chaperone TorD family protein [Niameybacter sp.]|uniref:TorD/DmsD family molecular chaperone n=1 Tax=Niameybacter sp. TaxID=2033640 RepID=UPI002FCB05F7
MENKKEIQEIILANRIYLYELTHALFGGEPSDELLKQMATDHTAIAWSLYTTEADDTFDAMSAHAMDLKMKLKEEGFLEQVKTEYTKLLIGPGKLVAYPWASMYLGREKMLFLESTVAVRKAYQQYGFVPQAYLQVADDHLAIELHFMAKMSARAQEAFAQGDLETLKFTLEGQKTFIKEHLLTWIPQYAKDMEQAPTDFVYPQFAKGLEAFIRVDLELLESELFA